MRLPIDDGLVEIERGWVESTAPDRDVLLSVHVEMGPYSGTDDSWVARSDWDAFVKQLRALEKSRQGTAVLSGAMPSNFSLTFSSADAAGHLSVTGILGWERVEGLRQELRFATTLDSEHLARSFEELCSLGDQAPPLSGAAGEQADEPDEG
jgi:hypothetical protein